MQSAALQEGLLQGPPWHCICQCSAASLECTERQVGAPRRVPQQSLAYGRLGEARSPAPCWTPRESDSQGCGHLGREVVGRARGPPEPSRPVRSHPSLGLCCFPPYPFFLLSSPPSPRAPLAARANPLGVLQRWTPVTRAPASMEGGVRTAVGPTCASAPRASSVTTVRQVGAVASLWPRSGRPLLSPWTSGLSSDLLGPQMVSSKCPLCVALTLPVVPGHPEHIPTLASCLALAQLSLDRPNSL